MSRVQVRLVAATATELVAAADAMARVLQVEHRSAPRPRRDGGVAVYLDARLIEDDDRDQDQDQDQDHGGRGQG